MAILCSGFGVKFVLLRKIINEWWQQQHIQHNDANFINSSANDNDKHNSESCKKIKLIELFWFWLTVFFYSLIFNFIVIFWVSLWIWRHFIINFFHLIAFHQNEENGEIETKEFCFWNLNRNKSSDFCELDTKIVRKVFASIFDRWGAMETLTLGWAI